MGNQVRVGFGITGVGKASSDLDKLKDKITGINKAGAGGVLKEFGTGVAIGAGVGAFHALRDAIGGVGDALGDAVKGAMADEESQNRLKSSLQANVLGWNGNTDAIEANILAKQRLGFDDETLRDSLTVLVGATHDVTKATEIQNTAMDLARFKGIDLRTASEALIKVEAGQYRSLKQLGIKLKDNATQQDALNAVQKVATGQAEAYAKTTAGKMVAAQTKMNEALENLGYTLLPVATDAVDAFSNALDSLTGSQQQLLSIQSGVATTIARRSVEDLKTARAAIVEGLNNLGGMDDADAGFANFLYGGQRKALKDQLAAIDAALASSGGGLKQLGYDADHTAKRVDDAAGDMGDAVTEFASETHTATEDAASDWKDFTDQLVSDVDHAISDAFDPMRAKADILAAEEKLHASEAILARKHTAQEYRDARDDINGALEDEATALERLGEKHQLSKKAVEKFKKDTVAAYKAMGKSVPPEIQKVITRLEVLAGYDGGAVDVNIHATVTKGAQGHHAGKGGPNEGKAAGGPVEAGEAYTVGENGPETLVMGSQPGRIIPNGGSTTVNIYGADVSSPSRLAEVVRRAMTISQGAPWETGGAMR